MKKHDTNIIKTFENKKTLSPHIFKGVKMIDEVTKKLLEITNMFVDFIEFDTFFIYDVRLTGSLANYNWSKFSDVDLHIICDYDDFEEQKEIIKNLIQTKKSLYAAKYDLYIDDYPIEVYVQDINEEHNSGGVYSVLYEKWLKKPSYKKIKIDTLAIRKVVDELRSIIKSNITSIDGIEYAIDKIAKLRKSALHKNGEYSVENLAFKVLRRNGDIQKLHDTKTKLINKELSL